MRKIFKAIVLSSIILTAPLYAQTPDTLWTRTYGGSNWDVGRCVKTTYNKGYIITGYTNTNAGDMNLYLIKTDSLGSIEWTKSIGDTDDDEEGFYVTQTFDSGFVIVGSIYSFSTYDENIYIVKTNSQGDTLWTRTLGSDNSDIAYSVIQTVDSYYIVTGKYNGNLYIAKLSDAGDTLWTKTYGSQYQDAGYSICETSDSNYVISGRIGIGSTGYDIYLIKINTSGNIMWYKDISSTGYSEGRSVIQNRDGGFVIAGSTTSYGPNATDIIIVKTDENGNVVWNKAIGDTTYEGGYSVLQTEDGGFVISGYTSEEDTEGNANFYILKTDGNGNILWTRILNNYDVDDKCLNASFATDSTIIATGYIDISSTGDRQVYLVSFGGVSDVQERKTLSKHMRGIDYVCNKTVSFAIPDNTKKTIQLEIYNILGNRIENLQIHPINNQPKILWNTPKKGVYFYKLTIDNTGKYSGKIIVQ